MSNVCSEKPDDKDPDFAPFISATGGTIDSNLFTGSNNNVAIGYQCGQFVGTGAENNVLIGFDWFEFDC